MAKKERTLNEIRQVKDSVYNPPKNHGLTDVEQKLLKELNYKAKLILDIEAMFKSKNIPCHTKHLFSLNEEQLESVLEVWKSY